MAEQTWPEALQDIVDLFAESPPQDRLELLLEYAMSLPDLPEELQAARDQMEPVPECQTPVFLASTLRTGRVYYHIDVPRESPTVRGFAGILYEGLNGAPPEAIQATPGDLYERLGLNAVLSPQRVRGLTALLARMKRQARDLARAA
ncbi:MAG: SufE family protein [Ardenticatenaceae bacterium]|nr:SufE family protein [Ardenticatenaceae bacterium]HBY93317.1 cysteine desulfuration protein SufE [Chloroflexota bacterium]